LSRLAFGHCKTPQNFRKTWRANLRTKTERPYCARVARTARDKTGKPDIKGKDLLRYGPNNFNGLGAPCTIGVPSGLNKKAQFDAFRGALIGFAIGE
jgi:hypothetical protein